MQEVLQVSKVSLLLFLLNIFSYFQNNFSFLVREETRNLTSEELQELSELNMFDESNLCHLEVRDPNPPEVIAEKFESKAQAVLDSISTHGSPPIIEKQNIPPVRAEVQSLAGKNNVYETNHTPASKTTSLAAAASEKARSAPTNVGTKVIPTVRPTRTKLKETVSWKKAFHIF